MKTVLLKKMLSDPNNFSDTEMKSLLANDLNFEDLRQQLQKIYDLNPGQLHTIDSSANTDSLGMLNRISTNKRVKHFFKKIARRNPDKKYISIYAEGDSWFQFPLFVTDILDWLRKEDSYLLYTEAYGGDWLSNIIYEGQYVSALSKFQPDVFLISGGGNDLVGSENLAHMVTFDKGYPKYSGTVPGATPEIAQAILSVQSTIRKEFYAFMLVLKAQYLLLLDNLYHKAGNKYSNMLTITQGYDYPYPTPNHRFSWLYPHQFLINRLAETGKWLHRPLAMKGIMDPKIQRNILIAFIFEFNEMMRSIATSAQYPNMVYIDCRGVAPDFQDWFDELHLKSHHYKKIAQAYKLVIEDYHNPDMHGKRSCVFHAVEGRYV